MLHTIDVSSFADGNAHTLTIEGTTDDFFSPTDFMIDNVSIQVCD